MVSGPGLPEDLPPPPPELYNIATDPLELDNVAEAHPDRVRRMRTKLEAWFEEVEAERATIDNKREERR